MPSISFYLKEMLYAITSFLGQSADREDIIWARVQLDKISFPRSIFTFTSRIEEKADNGKCRALLITGIKVYHRDTGYDIDVVQTADITNSVIARDQKYIRDYAFLEYQRLLQHELQELFHFENKRVFDPHKNDLKTK